MNSQNGSTGHTGGGHFIHTVHHVHVLDHGHFTDIGDLDQWHVEKQYNKNLHELEDSRQVFILFYLLVIKDNDPAVKISPGRVRGNRQSFSRGLKCCELSGEATNTNFSLWFHPIWARTLTITPPMQLQVFWIKLVLLWAQLTKIYPPLPILFP